MFYPYFSINTYSLQPKYEVAQIQIKIANSTCADLKEKYNFLAIKPYLLRSEIVSLEIKIESINEKIDNLTLHQINRDSLQSTQNILQTEIYKLQAKIKTLEMQNSILEGQLLNQLSNLTRIINNQCPQPNLILPPPKPSNLLLR